MTRIIRTAGQGLALLILSLSASAPAMADYWTNKYGYCQGLAGKPTVNNYSRLFVLGPSSPPDALSGFLRYLHKKFSGYVSQELGCRTFATAAEAETAYRQMLNEGTQHFQQTGAWPLTEIDWIPEGGSALHGGAPAAAPAPAPAAAQADTRNYGFCYGFAAGTPPGAAFTRVFVFGPSRPAGWLPSYFLNYLLKKYGSSRSDTSDCPLFATAAEAEAKRKEMISQSGNDPRYPTREEDWIPEGAKPLSGAAPAPAPAPAASKPPVPAPVAAAPAASAGPKLDYMGRPISPTAWWLCWTHLKKNLYVSAPFFANTLDRSPQEMFEQFLDYLNKRYHEGGTATCNKYASQAEAEQEIARQAAEAPGTGYQYAEIDYVYTPGSSKSSQSVAAAAPAPVAAKPVSAAPSKPVPAPVPAKSPAAVPAKPAATIAAKPGVWVICRVEWNTDLRRFYNGPVDGRGAGYPEWQASYQQYLVKHHKFKGSGLGCGKYPTREAAQKDFESWVVTARQQPMINGVSSPVIITNWKY